MKIMRTSPLNALLPSLLALCCTLSISVSSQAQEFRYITDVLYVPLRSGAGNEFRIINAALRTGTQLKFLEEDAEGKWAKVVTPNNVEGWIPTQYIMSERPAQMQLTEALAKIAELEQETAQLQTRNQTLLNENQQLQGQSTDALTSRDSMSKELQRIRELSRNAIQLESTNQELVEKHQLIQTERDALFAENENLKSDQRTDFMLYGAGLVILGVILALLIPALIPKKGYSEWK